MAVSLRNHGDYGAANAVYAVQAPQWYRASGMTGGGGIIINCFSRLLQLITACSRVVSHIARSFANNVAWGGPLPTSSDLYHSLQ